MTEKYSQKKKPLTKQTSHHDKLFKQAYSDPAIARELFQLVFSKEEWPVFDWENLRPEKDTFPDKRADLLFSVPLKNNPEVRFRICLLLEHKSQYNRGLFYQLLSYQTLIIGKTFHETGQAWPVIPVVFYHGKDPWNWKTSFQEGFWGEFFSKIPVSARKSMLNYELRLLDTHDPQMEKVLKDKSFKSRGFLKTLKETWFLKADEDVLNETISLFDNWVGDRDDLLLSLGDYFWATIPGMTKELWKKVERAAVDKGIFQKGGYMNIREHIREEGIQEGIQKGIQEGIQKGIQEGIQKGHQEEKRQVILKMLQKETDISFISEVTGLSEEEIEKLKNGS